MSQQPSEPKYPELHIYSQYCEHQDAYLVGNRQALIILRDTLNQVLDSNQAHATGVFASDGEGYNILILPSEDISELRLPYSADYISKEGDHPYASIQSQYKTLYQEGLDSLQKVINQENKQ